MLSMQQFPALPAEEERYRQVLASSRVRRAPGGAALRGDRGRAGGEAGGLGALRRAGKGRAPLPAQQRGEGAALGARHGAGGGATPEDCRRQVTASRSLLWCRGELGV